MAQPDLSDRPVVYFRVLISLLDPLISRKFSSGNISFPTLLPRHKRPHTPLTRLDTHTPAVPQNTQGMYTAGGWREHKGAYRPRNGKSSVVLSPRGACCSSASAQPARSRRARSSARHQTDSSAARRRCAGAVVKQSSKIVARRPAHQKVPSVKDRFEAKPTHQRQQHHGHRAQPAAHAPSHVPNGPRSRHRPQHGALWSALFTTFSRGGEGGVKERSLWLACEQVSTW